MGTAQTIDIKEVQANHLSLGKTQPLKKEVRVVVQRNDIIVDLILELVLLQEGGQMIEVVNHLDGVVTIKLVQGILDLL